MMIYIELLNELSIYIIHLLMLESRGGKWGGGGGVGCVFECVLNGHIVNR